MQLSGLGVSQNDPTAGSITSISTVEHADLLQLIKRMPKIELHCHVGGAWTLDYLQKIAEPDAYNQLCQMLDKIQKGIDYHEAFDVFSIIARIVNSEKKVEEGVAALCKKLSEDSVTYVELRTSPKKLPGGSGLEGYLRAVLRGIERGMKESQIQVKVILSMQRSTGLDDAKQIVNLALQYRNQGVVGLDLSGDSTIGEGLDAIQELKRAKSEGLFVTLHIGESAKESEASQLYELEQIQPDRIGHGVVLLGKARTWVLDNKTPIELCLTSAFRVGMTKQLDKHPALELMRQKHPVIVCTDDPLIFRVTLSEELERVAKIANLSLEEIQQLQQTAMKHKFISS